MISVDLKLLWHVSPKLRLFGVLIFHLYLKNSCHLKGFFKTFDHDNNSNREFLSCLKLEFEKKAFVSTTISIYFLQFYYIHGCFWIYFSQLLTK